MDLLFSSVGVAGAMTQGCYGDHLIEPYQKLGLTAEFIGRRYDLPRPMTHQEAIEFVLAQGIC
jgi:hypothetical protein